ncbi:MAG: TAXI family TRAP transporter solute-binding subunit [Pseudolabrys sp.]|jgi:TRAP transporter TAXI family solute receptor
MANKHMKLLQNRALRLVAAAGMVTALAAPSVAHAELKRITIGTNAAGTLYNQIGTVVSTLLQKSTGIPTNVRPFAGTSVYLPKLHRGEIDFGLNSALDSSIAYHGEDEYKQPLSKVRGVMMIARAYYGFYAKNSSGLKSVGDLKGKPTVMSYRAIASFDHVNQAVIATAGLKLKDVKPVVVSGIADTVRGIVDGRFAAGGTIIGIPMLREANATVSGGLKVLELGPNDEPINALAGFTAVTIKPRPPFVGVSKPMKVPRFDVFLNTGAHLSADDVYKVVKVIYQNWSSLQKDVPALRSIPAKDLAPLNFGHPYHVGAVRFFKEAGLWTPAHEKRQETLLKAENMKQ